MAISLPNCRIDDQVVFSPKGTTLTYRLGVIAYAEINGGGWRYKVISDKEEFVVKEIDIKGVIFPAVDRLTKQEMTQEEDNITL